MDTVAQKVGVITCEDLPKWGGEEGSCKLFIKYLKSKGRLGQGNISNEHWPSLPEIDWVPINGISGKLPDESELKDYAGFIMSGSHYSVNDDEPWIKRLQEWVITVRNFQENNVKSPRIVGLCFSHQLINKAFGGTVGRLPSQEFTWKAEEIEINETANSHMFFDHPGYARKSSFKLFESHGECVVSLPEDAKTLGSSASCEHEIVSINDHIITMQSHPEITAQLMIEIILPSLKAKSLISEQTAESSMRSFKTGMNDDLMIDMIKHFILKDTNQTK